MQKYLYLDIHNNDEKSLNLPIFFCNLKFNKIYLLKKNIFISFLQKEREKKRERRIGFPYIL